MCDYSLHAIKSRPAKVGDKLKIHNWGTGTKGFADANDPSCAMAICVLPGTEIAFDKQITKEYVSWFSALGASGEVTGYDTAIFRQIDKDQPYKHHDALEFPDGKVALLTNLKLNQLATVLQLPAQPKTEQEAQEQKRLEIVG